MNPTNPVSGPQQTSSSLQQNSVSGTQPAATGFQTSTSTQDSTAETSELLNQGVSAPTLPVVSAPYSTTPSAIVSANSPGLQAQPEASGTPWLAILLVAGFIVALSVTTWNRYIKTPIPATKHKRR